MRFADRGDKDRACRSETPRPSSRETAKPPCWASAGAKRSAGNRLCELDRKEQFVLNGPRRAQARKPLAENIRPDARGCGSQELKQAHAVTSRVTSWAFWFPQLNRYDWAEREGTGGGTCWNFDPHPSTSNAFVTGCPDAINARQRMWRRTCSSGATG